MLHYIWIIFITFLLAQYCSFGDYCVTDRCFTWVRNGMCVRCKCFRQFFFFLRLCCRSRRMYLFVCCCTAGEAAFHIILEPRRSDLKCFCMTLFHHLSSFWHLPQDLAAVATPREYATEKRRENRQGESVSVSGPLCYNRAGGCCCCSVEQRADQDKISCLRVTCFFLARVFK